MAMSSALIKCIVVLSSLQLLDAALIRGRYANRLTQADWSNYNLPEPSGPGSYAFGYDVEDAETNNIQFRSEERHPNGTVTGSYGYLLPDGNVQKVSYVADNLGYRASVEILPRGGMPKPMRDVDQNQLPDLALKALPAPRSRVPDYKPIQELPNQYPLNIPDYVTAYLANENNFKSIPSRNPRSKQYYQTILKAPANFKNRFENFYLVPY